jgi:predicted short-subunit dehydrogenase-like oxidoreductase (DUF2520 family)
VLAAGGEVTGVHGRTARDAGAPVGAVSAGDFPDALQRATLVFVAVQDRELDAVVAQLVAAPALPAGLTVLQASGSTVPQGFTALRRRGVACGTFHPLVPLATPEHAPALLRGAWVGISGDDRALLPARALAALVRAHVLRIPPDAPATYHAAAVFASNFPIVLAALAERLLREAGVAREEARPAVRHLLSAAASNLARGDDAALALTGPVVRGDVLTVRRHLDALLDDDEARAVYRTLAAATLNVARDADADAGAMAEIARLLDGTALVVSAEAPAAAESAAREA